MAGAGAAALLGSRRGKDGALADDRGKKVLLGSALGALGTEAIKRAQSAYGDKFGDGEQRYIESNENSEAKVTTRRPARFLFFKIQLSKRE